jgi:hypothetical protein
MIDFLQLGESLLMLNIQDNPVTQVLKFRHWVAKHSMSLLSLNGKEITEMERKYIKRMDSVKHLIPTVLEPLPETPQHFLIPHLPPYATQYRYSFLYLIVSDFLRAKK